MLLRNCIFLLLTYLLPLGAIQYNAPVRTTSNGLSIWTESLGEWSGEKAILLVSGCGGNARFWPDYMCQQFLDEGFFVIRYDHRSAGLSDPSPFQFQMPDLARDAIAILDAYNIEKAHIVGMSMGGMVTQFMAANYPHRVKTMTIIASAPIGATPRLDRPLSLKETLILADTFYYLGTNPLTKNYEESLPTFKARFAHFNGDYPLDEEMAMANAWSSYFRTIHPFTDSGGYHVSAVENLMHSLDERRDIFKRIVVPTLIIHGLKDTVILPSRGGEAIHEAIEHATLKLYPGMGHSIYHRKLLDEIVQDILELIFVKS